MTLWWAQVALATVVAALYIATLVKLVRSHERRRAAVVGVLGGLVLAQGIFLIVLTA